jgi:outer membrane PBP1 activator LpoA protein
MMNLSGTNCLARKINNLLTAVLVACFLAACATPGPAPAPVEEREVQERVREPASQQNSGVQVYPLQNPAVKSLVEEAREAESAGNYDTAAVSLERAMRIQPRNPELLQYMAEIQLHKKDYDQAMSFAIRSFDTGSRVGEVCSRNRHTISVARDHKGDKNGAQEAKQRAGECMSTKPQQY